MFNLDGKLVDESCGNMLLRTIDQHPASIAVDALLAEIAASRDITISLLFAFSRDGHLSERKVREIVAHREKPQIQVRRKII